MSSLRASAASIRTGRCFSASSLLDRRQQLEAVHRRHLDVGDDDVDRRGAQLLERGQAVARLVDVGEADLAQQAAQDAAHASGNRRRRARASRRSARRRSGRGRAFDDRAGLGLGRARQQLQQAVLGLAVHHDDADAAVHRAAPARPVEQACSTPGPARAASGRRAGRRRRARGATRWRGRSRAPSCCSRGRRRRTAGRRCGLRA